MTDFVWDQNQILSLIGATLLLIAFLGGTFFKLNQKGLLYASFNFIGTALLAITVWKPLNLGIFVVETIWSLASLILCIQILRNHVVKSRP